VIAGDLFEVGLNADLVVSCCHVRQPFQVDGLKQALHRGCDVIERLLRANGEEFAGEFGRRHFWGHVGSLIPWRWPQRAAGAVSPDMSTAFQPVRGVHEVLSNVPVLRADFIVLARAGRNAKNGT
jgi:hypothetical protein